MLVSPISQMSVPEFMSDSQYHWRNVKDMYKEDSRYDTWSKSTVVNSVVGTVFQFLKELYLVSYSVNLVLVAAVTQIVVDSAGSALFGQSGRFLHPLLVNIPQHQHSAKSRELLSHEATDPTT